MACGGITAEDAPVAAQMSQLRRAIRGNGADVDAGELARSVSNVEEGPVHSSVNDRPERHDRFPDCRFHLRLPAAPEDAFNESDEELRPLVAFHGDNKPGVVLPFLVRCSDRREREAPSG
jgi:hypothetical protein